MAGEEMNEIKKITKVCKNVYYDHENNKYFCQLCGKATFDTRAQAIGHLSVCRVKDMRLGVVFPTTELVAQAVMDGVGSEVTESGFPDVSSPTDLHRKIAILEQELAHVRSAQARYANEIPHIQAAQQLSSLGIPTIWIVVGAIALIALMFREDKPCNCETTQKKVPASFTMSLLSRFANKAVDKAGNVLFG